MSWIKKSIIIGIFIFLAPIAAKATVNDFFINPSYDYSGRATTTAFLHQIGERAYFYIEDDYYKNLEMEDKKILGQKIKELSQEFDNVIYPKLTGLYGSEWNPGIDNDRKIFILITKIKGDNGGYFNSGDEYPKAQVSDSNAKEMLYLNANYITHSSAKVFLAHEFVHLISFNQKEKILGKEDEIWLNEGRAEQSSTFLGYDDKYEGSVLQKRVAIFFQKPQDSLTEWKNESSDYGSINLFMQYFVDHYGVKVLADSLTSKEIGIISLNEALNKNGFSDDFSTIFTNWLITILVNDCNVGPKYCYLNPNLKNLRVLPQFHYLPFIGESVLTVTNYTKNWTGNWLKFIGGQGTFKLEFTGDSKAIFKVPYLTRDSAGKYSVNFFDLNGSQHGVIYISNFGEKYESLTILPSIQKKLVGFNGVEQYYQYIWSASILSNNTSEDDIIKELMAQIINLQKEIARIQAQINSGQSQVPIEFSCQNKSFVNNLYYGMNKNQNVSCLQEFLKSQGKEIYPEALVTGNFLSATKAAVIRFQEKYKDKILTPAGLQQGTGYFGLFTRNVANQIKTGISP